jgi:hypothetical protein
MIDDQSITLEYLNLLNCFSQKLPKLRPFMFPPPGLASARRLLLVTDQLSAPADFILHQNVISSVKEKKNVKTIVIAVSENLARWKAVAAKSVSPESC